MADELVDDIDEAISSLLDQGPLPDVRDQGRTYRYGELLRILSETRKVIGVSQGRVQVAWMGKKCIPSVIP